MKKIGIYKITCLITGKNYVGQSTNIDTRFKHYRLRQCEGQPVLHKSLTEYGIENHSFTILEQFSFESKEQVKAILAEREEYWTRFYSAFVDNGGLVSRVGGKHGY